MHPDDAAAYYASKYGSARAALDSFSPRDLEDYEGRALRVSLGKLIRAEGLAAEASRQAVAAKAALFLNGIAA